MRGLPPSSGIPAIDAELGRALGALRRAPGLAGLRAGILGQGELDHRRRASSTGVALSSGQARRQRSTRRRLRLLGNTAGESSPAWLILSERRVRNCPERGRILTRWGGIAALAATILRSARRPWRTRLRSRRRFRDARPASIVGVVLLLRRQASTAGAPRTAKSSTCTACRRRTKRCRSPATRASPISATAAPWWCASTTAAPISRGRMLDVSERVAAAAGLPRRAGAGAARLSRHGRPGRRRRISARCWRA